MELATETFDFDLQRVFDECSSADFANRTAVKLFKRKKGNNVPVTEASNSDNN